MAASEVELASVEGIGAVIAASLVKYFASADNRAMIDRLRSGGVRFTAAETPGLSKNLLGKTVVVTGTLAGMSREEAEAPSSGGGKVTRLGVGQDPGACRRAKPGSVQADQGGVPRRPIIDEEGSQSS